MPSRLMRAHNRCHRLVDMGTNRWAAWVLGVVSQQDAVQVLGFEPGGYHGVLRFAVLLDLLLHVDAGHAVALLQLVGHERVSFAFPHAGGEREFEQQHPGFVHVHGQGRAAAFRAAVGHGLDQLFRLVG